MAKATKRISSVGKARKRWPRMPASCSVSAMALMAAAKRALDRNSRFVQKLTFPNEARMTTAARTSSSASG